MKTLFVILLSIFSLTMMSNAGMKRVAINKVINAIEEDAEQAMKDYKSFKSRFAIEDYDYSTNLQLGKVENTNQSVNLGTAVTENKKYLFECTLEKYKDSKGKEKVRIKVTKAHK